MYIYIKQIFNSYIYELNESPHILCNLWIFLCVIMLQQHVDITT